MWPQSVRMASVPRIFWNINNVRDPEQINGHVDLFVQRWAWVLQAISTCQSDVKGCENGWKAQLSV